jgi:Plasmid replication region DNA-binding N-term
MVLVISAFINSQCVIVNTSYVWCMISAMVTLSLSPIPRGISQSDVSHAADSLLRLGERPTNDKVRAKIGKGSLSTIGPLLDAWWKTLAARLDSGPAAFHRLPEVVAHVAESLWMQALDEAARRIRAQQKTTERQNADKEQTLEVRSHVLTLREGELDSRLRDRERTIEELNLRLREITGMLRKEQATREILSRQLAERQPALPRTFRPKRRVKSSVPRRSPVRKKPSTKKTRLRSKRR